MTTIAFFAVPALLAMLVTGLYGLNEIHFREFPDLRRPTGWVQVGLILSLLSMVLSTTYVAMHAVLGTALLPIPIVVLLNSFAGVTILAGKHMPWRVWFPRAVAPPPHDKTKTAMPTALAALLLTLLLLLAAR